MAVRSKVGLVKDGWMPGRPKMTRQGSGKNTKYAATSRNKARKALEDKDGDRHQMGHSISRYCRS